MHRLFDHYRIGSLDLKNRFVRSATQDWLSEADGQVSNAQLELYGKLAEGGVGTIITGHSFVSNPAGRAAPVQNAIYDDKFIDGYKRLGETVHQFGARLILQLAHAGRQTAPEIIDGQMPVAPSDLFDDKGAQVARALTYDDMQRMLDNFATAAMRAKRAGLDGVQIHMAHGYLLAQFLSPYTNKRDDEYGGSADRRVRFPAEVVWCVREAVGKTFPILIKLNSTDGLSDPALPQVSLEDVVFSAAVLADHSVDAIEVSGGTIKENRLVMAKPGITAPELESYFQEAAAAIRKKVQIPVILVGGNRSVEKMKQLIDDGQANMISMSRPFVREPDLANKLEAGQEKATCVSCNGCFNPKGLRCALEPI